MTSSTKPKTTLADSWFKQHSWQPFPFQREVWDAVAQGASGLLHATTGSGKTYAVWLAALNRFAPPQETKSASAPNPSPKRALPAPLLTVLWITPMRALAADTGRALLAPLLELGIPWSVGVRSGDTTSSERAKQSRRLPTALITTPESLSLLLSRADAHELFSRLRMVVVDEWHELIGNKRGVQLQLALARLRSWQPELLTWGLSATLGNLAHAMEVLIPQGGGQLVQGSMAKELLIDTLLPPGIERFPWAGHLGLRMLPQVIAEIGSSATSLIFTNTRSQSEIWYQALVAARPDWAGLIALHHGSLDNKVRSWVELARKTGKLKAVVCTSSLDLGVDFLPVERVLQIGSPKGVARLMQRAGRSGHAPGGVSRLTMVPTHSLELVESIAAQDAIAARKIEPRVSPHQPLDVLVQHLVTVAMGGGFRSGELNGPEMQLVKPLLEVQLKWSALPTPQTLLAEVLQTREGWHLFLYPYAGRNVHLGLASLLAWRIGKKQPNTFSIAVNDYGFEMLSATEMDWPRSLGQDIFSTEHLLDDVLGSLNAGELAQRRFREIARISGLVFTGYPGVPKSTRQVQASSRMFYDVFGKYDPGNLLLAQSKQEVLHEELDVERLRASLVRMKNQTLQWQQIQRPTPFAFPLLVERLRESSSSEQLSDRIARMVADLEKAAGSGGYQSTENNDERRAFSKLEPKRPRRERERKDGRPRLDQPRRRHGP